MTTAGPEGLLLVDKPGGMTSHDVVDVVRRRLGTKKVGHAGTLDPMATGLLLVGVGRATRLLRFLSDLPKTYEGTMRLGVETTTLDAEGEIVREAEVTAARSDVEQAMRALEGESMQRPPAYSAVKVGGRKLYEAARAGEQLEAEPRPIRVDAFDLLGFDSPDATFRVACSTGTYVRVLAADVGAALSCGAHLTSLRRTAIGPFRASDASPPEGPGDPLPAEDAVRHLPRLDLEAEEAVAASHGRPLGPAGLAGPYGVFDPVGRLIGVYEDDGPKARPQVVLAP
ncbi:MAG TPA: tRNA pseudouridine(55) synthase TruB [Actinomycetota bacterium]|nr:tRNA pseudouridine(55) synthase TruB [Actinomycetota bacterium]